MIYNTAKVSNIGTTTPNMMEHTTKVISMDREATLGQMGQIIQVNGYKTELKDAELILGKTEEFTQDHGWTITWKVMESTHGLTEDAMKVNI